MRVFHLTFGFYHFWQSIWIFASWHYYQYSADKKPCVCSHLIVNFFLLIHGKFHRSDWLNSHKPTVWENFQSVPLSHFNYMFLFSLFLSSKRVWVMIPVTYINRDLKMSQIELQLKLTVAGWEIITVLKIDNSHNSVQIVNGLINTRHG